MEENIIDLGSITVPTKWEEVTLKQFQEIERYYDGKDKGFDVRDVINVFIGRTKDEINAMPMDIMEIIMEKLLFLQGKPEEKEATNKIVIDGVEYSINVKDKLKVGEYVAVDTLLKDDKHNYAALLAILCRKDGEIYDSKFENEVLEKRIKLYEGQPITNILPIVSFFLQLYIRFTTPSLLSSHLKEAIDLTRSNIETSQKNGEISKRYMKSAMKKLKKLEKSINSI